MQRIWRTLLKGIVAVFPIGITIYLVYWLTVSVEKILRTVITQVVPEHYYWPGLGLVAGLALLFFIGLIVNAWVVQRLMHWGEHLLEKIPLVKSIYSALRDFMHYFSTSDKEDEMKKVVMVTINDMQLIGFVTGELRDVPGIADPNDKVAVYLPMSYQLGGFTVYLPQSCVETLDMSVEDAMRRVLTAGLSMGK